MIEQLLVQIAKQLDEKIIPYIIIGGQAVLIYGRPRMTRDIDLTLGIDVDQYDLIENICRKMKLKILPPKPRQFTKETKVLPAQDEKSLIRIDFIFSFSFYEQQAIKRAKKVDVINYPVKFASLEDIIVHKILAGRAIDEEDVKSIIIKNKNRINQDYIKRWLSEFKNIAEYSGAVKKFKKILKQTAD